MTREDIHVVRRKLATVVANVAALESVQHVSLQEYRANLWQRKAVERFLQEAIEAAMDCGSHILIRNGQPPPGDLYSTFGALSALGVLDDALARSLAPSAGLRNRIVHEYDELDDARVHAALPVAVRDLSAFVAAVEAWLQRQQG